MKPQSRSGLENPTSRSTLESLRMPVQAKLAAAWTSFMFLYLYVDYLALYKPGVIDNIRAGIIHEFDIGQTFVISAITLLSIPILMILLSVILPARANRMTNLIVAPIYVLVSAYNAAGETWYYYYTLTIGLEVILLALIVRYAWTWPRHTATPAAGLDSQPVRAPQQA